MVPPISHLLEQFCTTIFHHNSLESSESAHHYTIASHKDGIKNESQKFEVYYCIYSNAYPMPVLIFDGLWPINLNLLSQKGDCSASHGALRIRDGSWCQWSSYTRAHRGQCPSVSFPGPGISKFTHSSDTWRRALMVLLRCVMNKSLLFRLYCVLFCQKQCYEYHFLLLLDHESY